MKNEIVICIINKKTPKGVLKNNDTIVVQLKIQE